MPRLLRTDGINVLVHRIGSALIPALADALHGRQNFNKLSHLARHDRPPFAYVAVQRQGLVLGENVDSAEIGVNAIGKRDIYNAIDAAEGYGRFGAIASQRIEPFARSARQQNSQGIFHSVPALSFWDGLKNVDTSTTSICVR